MYLHFLPFTDAEMVQIVETLPLQNINLLLLNHQNQACWWSKEPEHLQSMWVFDYIWRAPEIIFVWL